MLLVEDEGCSSNRMPWTQRHHRGPDIHRNDCCGSVPYSMAVDPAGKFAYVVNLGSNDVSMYTINSTTGVLMSKGTIAAGQVPTSIAVHPSGKFAYVTNSESNEVSIYSIDGATGALTLIGTIGT